MTTEFPEHDKMNAVILNGTRDTVQEFLDWLLDGFTVPGAGCYTIEGDDPGVTLGFWRERSEGGGKLIDCVLEPAMIKREDLMHAFFGIDKKKIDAEKDAMLAEIREAM